MKNTTPGKIVLALGFAAGLWVAYLEWVTMYLPKWEKSGQFGDTFGGFSAFFSALAFLGVLLSRVLKKG